MPYYEHPFVYGSTNPLALDYKTYAVRQRLPAWRVCKDPKPPFILFGEDNWNCAKCEGEPAFFLPVHSADKFEFQFQFDDHVNEDAANAVFGWQVSASPENEYYMAAKILTCECAPVEGMGFVNQFASEWGVAYDAEMGAFQWLQLDIGLLPSELCCFILQVEQYVIDADTGDVVVDQIITAGPFARNDSNDCKPCADETVLLCGQWKKADCWGRRYDIPFGEDAVFTFTDCVRLPGNVVYLGTANEVLLDGEIEIKTVVRKKYRLHLKGVPPLIAEWVSTILGSNDFLSIDGYEINRGAGHSVGSFERERNDVQMFYGSIEFSTVCEVENFGCN